MGPPTQVASKFPDFLECTLCQSITATRNAFTTHVFQSHIVVFENVNNYVTAKGGGKRKPQISSKPKDVPSFGLPPWNDTQDEEEEEFDPQAQNFNVSTDDYVHPPSPVTQGVPCPKCRRYFNVFTHFQEHIKTCARNNENLSKFFTGSFKNLFKKKD